MTIKSILGKMFVNDKQIVVLDDTAENGGIESGSNANGNWVKYPDGTMVQYGRKTFTSLTIGTQLGTLFRSTSPDTVITLPLTFFGTLQDFSSSVYIGGSAYQSTTGFVGIQQIEHETNSEIRCPLIGTSAVTVDVTVTWKAIGRWK